MTPGESEVPSMVCVLPVRGRERGSEGERGRGGEGVREEKKEGGS